MRLGRKKIISVVDSDKNSNYVASDDLDPILYDDITSILNWYKFGDDAGLCHSEIRDEINLVYSTVGSPGYNWNLLNDDEKYVLSMYFLVDKEKRDQVMSQSDQDVYNHFRIYHHLSPDARSKWGSDFKITPKSIDYKKDLSKSLNPQYIFDQYGFLVQTIYYENVELVQGPITPILNYSVPVLKVDIQYFRDTLGYVTHRIVTRSWTLIDGTYSSDTKITTKYYDKLNARTEGRRRRLNLVSNIILETVGLIVMTSPDLNTFEEAEQEGRGILKELGNSISLYYESGAGTDNENQCPLIQDIQNSTYIRFDNVISTSPYLTIRDYIIMKLNP